MNEASQVSSLTSCESKTESPAIVEALIDLERDHQSDSEPLWRGGYRGQEVVEKACNLMQVKDRPSPR